MIVDTSALIAILEEESDSARISGALATAELRLISAATLLEARIAAERRDRERGARDLDLLLENFMVAIVPFTAAHADLAREGFRRFGKGRHPARLNLGDCFAYALAKERGEPLLFKGEDFSQTDIEAAVY